MKNVIVYAFLSRIPSLFVHSSKVFDLRQVGQTATSPQVATVERRHCRGKAEDVVDRPVLHKSVSKGTVESVASPSGVYNLDGEGGIVESTLTLTGNIAMRV